MAFCPIQSPCSILINRIQKWMAFRESNPLFGSEPQLPSVVGGLQIEQILYYPDPKLGISIRYGTPTTAKADAYLYDLGLSDILEHLRSQQVMEWFLEACQGVMEAAELGLYQDFEILASRSCTFHRTLLNPSDCGRPSPIARLRSRTPQRSRMLGGGSPTYRCG